MADKNVRVHRLVNDITLAPTGSDAVLDRVARAMSRYFAAGTAAYAGGSGTTAVAVPDDAASMAAYLAPTYPGAAVTTNTVWAWIINPVTGQRQLICYEAEVKLTQEMVGSTPTAINPPIGVRVESLMTILSPTP